MSEFVILKWSLIVASLLAIFTKTPETAEPDGVGTLFRQRDPYGNGSRFTRKPVDLWLTINAKDEVASDRVPHIDSIYVSQYGLFHRGFFVGGSKEDPSVVSLCEDFAQMGSDTAYLPVDSSIPQSFLISDLKIDRPVKLYAWSNGFQISTHGFLLKIRKTVRQEDGSRLYVVPEMKFSAVETLLLVIPYDYSTGESLAGRVDIQLFDNEHNEITVAHFLRDESVVYPLPPNFHGLLRVQLEGYDTQEVSIDNDMEGRFENVMFAREFTMVRIE